MKRILKKMVKGANIKCKNCLKTFWVESKLSFGIRKNEMATELLDCLLNEVKFYFRCPYCKESTIIGIEFFSNKPPEITKIVEDPNYIG